MAGDTESKMNVDAMRAKLCVVFKEAVFKDSFPEFAKAVQACLTSGNENDVRNIVELTVREVLLELLAKKTNMKILERVFQFSIDASFHELCYGSLPVLVLSDMFDGSTLNECETIFDFVENRVEILKKDMFFKTCKNHLLRTCNDLLRRLSRSQNTVFCGRILLFLARLFPLSERSGLNIISEFNFDNATVYSSKDEASADFNQEKDETMEEGEITARPVAADYNLYRKFWSLQEFFRNPNTCYNKMHWRHFVNYVADVLTVFGSFKSDDANSSKWRQTEVSSSSSSDGTFTYFAKYLTSPKLLELELSDSNFRRYVLIQFLILFQYLTSPVKFKLETYVLSEEQQGWIKDTTAKIYKLLEETPPDGPQFSKNIAKILRREEYWNTWKNEGCPDFKSMECNIESKMSRHKRRISDEMEQDKVLIGNSELTKLWNICPNNWEACRSSKRKFVPSLDEFFELAIEQADPVNQIENQYKVVNDPKFAWKSLRLLSMKSPHFFTSTVNNTQYKNLSQYLEAVIQKIPRETAVNQPEVTVADQGTPSVAEETLEDGNEEILHTSEEESREEVEKTKKASVITEAHIKELSSDSKVQSGWKLLAEYLDFKEDETAYFEVTYHSDKERVEKMLTVWMEQDPLGGSVTSFRCALQNAGLAAVASSVFPSS